MRLNIGCGGRRLPGYTGVDAVQRPAADIIAPAHAIPLPDGCADEVMAIHLWEHFYRWQCDDVIREWWRLLKPGGALVLEMPDLMKACQNIVDGLMKGGKHPDQLGMWACYGDPRKGDEWMAHRWGWTPGTITEFLTAAGFVKIKQEMPQFHPAGREHRDMRVIASKP